MTEKLERTCSDNWILDASPDIQSEEWYKVLV